MNKILRLDVFVSQPDRHGGYTEAGENTLVFLFVFLFKAAATRRDTKTAAGGREGLTHRPLHTGWEIKTLQL